MASENKNGSFDLKSYFIHKRVVIDNKLGFYLNACTFPGRLLDSMRYAVMAGGKRLRPVLCLAAAEAVSGDDDERLLAAGCAIEFIHTYSLIHDDLPAMDDDVLRRGKSTCHVAFDEATAILAGDALLTLAFEILSEDRMHLGKRDAKILQAINIISRAAGPRGMVEGQMQDMLSEGKTITPEMLERLHSMKTGALIRAAAETGALLAGANERQHLHMKEYAMLLGVAFQVADDILNVDGDPAIMGKSSGTDADKMKSTYPSLIGMDASRKKARQLISSALQLLDIFDTKADPLRAIAGYVIQRDR